jgi:ATP synthase regulation protein NCA2
MMEALHAMDQMMAANDINMNLAAITPSLLLFYGAQQLFRVVWYALLRLGKSREQTHASFRHVLTEIERLLVMRDNPPRRVLGSEQGPESFRETVNEPCVLGSDDLGMLMLLLHECRTILWKASYRFSDQVVRSLSEDLSELAGERGTSFLPATDSALAPTC